MAGFFVVIEGLDSSGKKLQATLLVRRLKEEGRDAKIVHFPRYDTEYGKLTMRYLNGEFGAKEQVVPEVATMFYAMDRYDFRSGLLHMLESGKIVVADRYTQSNLGFQGAKFRGAERAAFIGWMKALESRMPQPDMVVFLDVPVETTMKLMEQREQEDRGRKRDIHEADGEYQKEVRGVYLDIAAKEGWTVIDCTELSHTIRPVEAISDEIHAAVERRLKEIKNK